LAQEKAITQLKTQTKKISKKECQRLAKEKLEHENEIAIDYQPAAANESKTMTNQEGKTTNQSSSNSTQKRKCRKIRICQKNILSLLEKKVHHRMMINPFSLLLSPTVAEEATTRDRQRIAVTLACNLTNLKRD